MIKLGKILNTLTDMLKENNLVELELKYKDFRVKLVGDVLEEVSGVKDINEEDAYYKVISPLAGVFYRSSRPDALPYVEVGDEVAPGMVLCIIEAMKMMNEIICEVKGKLVKVLVENGQVVEPNQVLFLIQPIP